MRIISISIKKYGPIDEFTLEPGFFDVVFGLNEAGKTALVEVLAQILFKRTAANLRYEKPEEAAVELEDDGRTYGLPQKKMKIDLPAGDVANLMYVQASESAVFGSRGEARFWDGIKTMLSNVGAGITFSKLDEYIFDAVDLQPVKAEWKRSKQTEIERDLRRKELLGLFINRIGEIGKKESELAKLTAHLSTIKRRIEDIEQYRKYSNYAELTKLHNAYREAKSAAQDYERYKHEYLKDWQRLDLERHASLGEGRKVKEIGAEVKQLERDVQNLQNVEEYIISEGLGNVTGRRVDRGKQPTLVILSLIMLFAIGLTALGVLKILPLVPTLILLAGTVGVFVYTILRRRAKRKAIAEDRMWLEKARRVFPDISSIDELPDRMDRNQEELITKRTLVEEKRRIIDLLGNARPVDLIEKEIALLCAKTGLAELSDLEVKLSEKRKVEDELNRLGTRLAGLLEETNPKKWERMISDRKVIQPSGEPDVSMYGDLIEEQKKIQRQIDGLTRDIKLFREVEQARVDISDDHAAFVEFERLEKKLSNYELEKRAALAAREILRGMSGELDEFIEDVLQGKDSLSEYFRAVTERYARVFVENENFKVEDGSGITYTLESLSSGTQDQLLMCFRMAALTKVYAKGAFMILDDAFIFADWQRREKLTRLIQKFVQKGNQVIYLTSDDHTRDLLAEYGARVTVLE